jgi:hypothetical protein
VTSSYDYAIIRVVPRVERGECINVGVILFCRTRRFLAARVELQTERLLALAPDLDLLQLRLELDHLVRVCNSEGTQKDAGPIGQLSQSERFHWLVAPRSTIIQSSPVHSGLCTDPATTLEHLLRKLVL